MISEDDLRLLSESVADLLKQECDSLALHKFYDGDSALADRLWTQAADLGWLGIGLPEDIGGLGMGLPGLATLYQALGHAGAPGGFLATLTTAQFLSCFASEEVRLRVLPAVLSGDLEFAAPASPGTPLSIDATGRLSGKSGHLIGSANERMALVSFGSGATAGLALLGLDDPLVQREVLEPWDRTRHLSQLACQGALPLAVIDDPSGEAVAAYFQLLALAVAADSVGGGRRMAEQTVDYLKQRIQFGRPLASFQALKHRCANLFLALTPCEELVRHAVDAIDDRDEGAGMWSALAKASASDAFKFVAADCIQLHGGVGHTWEFDCHIFLKRALLNEVLAGDSNALRDGAARHLEHATLSGTSMMEIAA